MLILKWESQLLYAHLVLFGPPDLDVFVLHWPNSPGGRVCLGVGASSEASEMVEEDKMNMA